MATRQRGQGRGLSGGKDPGRIRPHSAVHPDRHPNSSANLSPQAFDFNCPLCNSYGKGNAKLNTDSGEWVVECWVCGSRRYLFELASVLGLRNAWALKLDARNYLAPFLTREARNQAEPEPLPTREDIKNWCRFLREEPDAMRYLLRERGLTPAVIQKYALGYDGRAFTIPILHVCTRQLVNLKRRWWPRIPSGVGKYKFLRGRGATLYPNLPAAGPLILCEGELDALLLRRHKLPGVTITTGMATRWRREWGDVGGRLIAVLYDAGPDGAEQAVARANELREAGADAYAVKLAKAGLRNKQDVTDWFVTYGRTRTQLGVFLNREYSRTLR